MSSLLSSFLQVPPRVPRFSPPLSFSRSWFFFFPPRRPASFLLVNDSEDRDAPRLLFTPLLPAFAICPPDSPQKSLCTEDVVRDCRPLVPSLDFASALVPFRDHTRVTSRWRLLRVLFPPLLSVLFFFSVFFRPRSTSPIFTGTVSNTTVTCGRLLLPLFSSPKKIVCLPLSREMFPLAAFVCCCGVCPKSLDFSLSRRPSNRLYFSSVFYGPLLRLCVILPATNKPRFFCYLSCCRFPTFPRFPPFTLLPAGTESPWRAQACGGSSCICRSSRSVVLDFLCAPIFLCSPPRRSRSFFPARLF